MSAFFSFIRQNNFAIEFLLSFLPVIPILKGRRFWYLKIIPFIVGVFIFSVFTFSTLMYEATWINVLWYMGVYVFAVAAIWISFKTDLWQAIYTVTCAYTLQNTFYKLKRLIDFAFAGTADAEVWSSVVYLPVLIALYLAFYFVFARRIKKQNNFEINNIKLLIISVIALFIVIFINLYFERFFFSIEMYNEINSVYFSIFGIVCCLLIFYNLYENIHNENVKEELRILNALWENDKRQYEIFKNSIDSINIKYHDLKHLIGKINNPDSADSEWIKETIKSLDIFGSIQKTGNEALDVLLVGLRSQCNNTDIRLTVEADGSLLCFMNDIDVYSLMGNALDNAVECVKKENSSIDKYINVYVKQYGSMVKIQIENCSTEQIQIENGFPVTTKSDRHNHGFGVKSIALITERYNGICHFEAADGKFILELMFPLKN